jgi:molecular chaperone GrpE
MNDHEDDIELAPDEDEGDDRADAKVRKLRDEIAALRKEKQEYMDGWQRAKADYVNALKRFEEEKVRERARGVLHAAEALLPALDALGRARGHSDVPPGFEAVAKQLENAFASLGLTDVGETGEPFDPNLHDALGQDQAESAEQDGTVSAVLEKGWRLGDTLVRPAKVRVAQWAPSAS